MGITVRDAVTNVDLTHATFVMADNPNEVLPVVRAQLSYQYAGNYLGGYQVFTGVLLSKEPYILSKKIKIRSNEP